MFKPTAKYSYGKEHNSDSFVVPAAVNINLSIYSFIHSNNRFEALLMHWELTDILKKKTLVIKYSSILIIHFYLFNDVGTVVVVIIIYYCCCCCYLLHTNG